MCVIIAMFFAIHDSPVASIGQCCYGVTPLAVEIKTRSVGSWTDLPKSTSQVSDRAEIETRPETHVLCNCHITLLPTTSWWLKSACLNLIFEAGYRVSCFSFRCPASSVIFDCLAILCLRLSVGEIKGVVKPFSY